MPSPRAPESQGQKSPCATARDGPHRQRPGADTTTSCRQRQAYLSALNQIRKPKSLGRDRLTHETRLVIPATANGQVSDHPPRPVEPRWGINHQSIPEELKDTGQAPM